MNKETPIYEIHVYEEPWTLNKHGFFDYGIEECVGFYYEKETALKAVDSMNLCVSKSETANVAVARIATATLANVTWAAVCFFASLFYRIKPSNFNVI